MSDLLVGLIGYGAIGRAVARGVAREQAGPARVVAVLVRHPERLIERPDGAVVTADFEQFLDAPTALVVECAGQESVRAYGERVLAAGKDLLLISVGALGDDALCGRLREAAMRAGRRVLLPSGAMGGLDMLAAAALGSMDEVVLTTRKPVSSLADAPGAVGQDVGTTRATCLFDGTAREAVRLFPQNVNVAAALSLAGIGFDRTRVRIFADPAVERNLHEIVARGDFGEYRMRIENIPSENPKTGRVTALSILNAIRRLRAPLVVG